MGTGATKTNDEKMKAIIWNFEKDSGHLTKFMYSNAGANGPPPCLTLYVNDPDLTTQDIAFLKVQDAITTENAANDYANGFRAFAVGSNEEGGHQFIHDFLGERSHTATSHAHFAFQNISPDDHLARIERFWAWLVYGKESSKWLMQKMDRKTPGPGSSLCTIEEMVECLRYFKGNWPHITRAG